jgi:hypothetical protein
MLRCRSAIAAGLILVQILGAACASHDLEHVEVAKAKEVVETGPTPTPKKVDPSLLALPTESLCNRLGEIEVINDRVPEENDDLYKAILAKGSDALPCLIEKINDRTKTRDPRSAPKWQHYVVGDTALFTVLSVASQDNDKRWEELMLGSLPSKYRDEWETNGVYAYFNYVSEPKNRKALQIWWKNWLKENKK